MCSDWWRLNRRRLERWLVGYCRRNCRLYKKHLAGSSQVLGGLCIVPSCGVWASYLRVRGTRREETRGIKKESKSQKAPKKIQELNESQRIRQVPALIVRPPGVIDFFCEYQIFQAEIVNLYEVGLGVRRRYIDRARDNEFKYCSHK